MFRSSFLSCSNAFAYNINLCLHQCMIVTGIDNNHYYILCNRVILQAGSRPKDMSDSTGSPSFIVL